MKNNSNKESSSVIELEQSILRVFLVCGFTLYTILIEYVVTNNTGIANAAICIGIVYSAVSAIILFNVKSHPGNYVSRRIFGMLCDISATSLAILYLGEFGAPIFAAYIWITIGNGFRYGANYLIASALLSVLGFLFVASQNQYWTEMYTLVWTGILILTVVPFYTAVLLSRLKEEKRNAVVASEEKSRFLANVSHELRTPLNAVIGFSELLGNPESRVSQQRLIGGIQNSARSLLSLVDGVLDFSRIETGRVDIEEKLLDLHALLESVSAMFSLEAGRKGVSLICEIDPGTPQNIIGDEYRLRQILVNLVGNAVKFTDAGKVHIRVERAGIENEGAQIRFVIEDTGIGIKDKTKAYVFERFRQVDDSARRRYSGTGLGTAISKHLVEAMGGEIGFDSKYGEGSSFWFTIPCMTPDFNVTSPEQQRTSGTGETLITRNAKPIKVLVAEDSDINREVFNGQLTVLGVAAVLADSGAAALEILVKEKVDIIILDVQMPGMSGLDFIRKYYDRTGIEDRVPIIVITGDATEDIQAKCEQLGVYTFLAKPVDLDKLRTALMEYANGNEVMAAAG